MLLLMAVSTTATAQESHYHRSLRSQDSGYGVTQTPAFQTTGGGGMYWSRTRDANDMAIVEQESREDSIARVKDFCRLCEKAYDAYEVKDYYRTILFGDSALTRRCHTPDLYYFMGVSYEKLGAYKEAEWGYKMAAKSGYIKEFGYYPAFKERMKQRKAEEKLLKKEAKKQKK